MTTRNQSVFESVVESVAQAILVMIIILIFLCLFYLIYTNHITLDHVWTCEFHPHWLWVEKVCTGSWVLGWHW